MLRLTFPRGNFNLAVMNNLYWSSGQRLSFGCAFVIQRRFTPSHTVTTPLETSQLLVDSEIFAGVSSCDALGFGLGSPPPSEEPKMPKPRKVSKKFGTPRRLTQVSQGIPRRESVLSILGRCPSTVLRVALGRALI